MPDLIKKNITAAPQKDLNKIKSLIQKSEYFRKNNLEICASGVAKKWKKLYRIILSHSLFKEQRLG